MTARRVAALLTVLAFPFALASPADAQASRSRAPAEPSAAPAAKTDDMVPKPKQQDKIFDLGATWIAQSLNGKPFGGGERPSFSIDKQYRARGFGGCNVFQATAYPLREQRLAVGPLLWTKKSCDKATMDAERSFFVALRNAEKWDLQGSTLVVKSQAGELRFERAL